MNRLDNRTTIFSPICNRDFKIADDGFIQAIPKGEFFHAESGLTEVVDDAALNSIFNSLVAETATRDTLIDFDHFSYDPSKSSEAAGWLGGKDTVQLRSDGLYIKPRLSDTGRASIESGRFRFISPVFMPGDVAVIGKNRVRPKRVDSWGVTNQPVMKGNPLSNRGGEAPPAENPNQPKGTSMKSLLAALGLSADASEESGIAAITALKNRATTAEGQATTLKTERDTLLGAQVEADLNQFADVIENRDEVKGLLLANRESTIKLLQSLKKPEAQKPAPQAKPMHNRATAKTPGTKPVASSEGNVSGRRAAAVEAYKLQNRCTYSAAWDQVRSLNPELFKEEEAAAS